MSVIKAKGQEISSRDGTSGLPSFLFIVGTGRCGTQMLRNILNCNSAIRVLPETHFIPTLYDKFGLEEISYDDFYEVISETYGSTGSRCILPILRDAGKSMKNS